MIQLEGGVCGVDGYSFTTTTTPGTNIDGTNLSMVGISLSCMVMGSSSGKYYSHHNEEYIFNCVLGL